MEIFKDRRWSLLLAGLFFLAVLATGLYVYATTMAWIPEASAISLHTILYGALGTILLSGSGSIWCAYRSRMEAMILKEDPEESIKIADACKTREAGSHDITERKKIELEIQYQNKKITESINYAKRIQAAILANSGLINRALPDSFILYKPRDVVSGDFPWFVQIRNEIFIAAVDCTGHGVPGALLSLVGYFLLNDIVRSRRITDPGKILDLLDEGVSTTLRPDEASGSKDGMDISLCRINPEQREVLYAGAHRSLYIMRNDELVEIKGNKFPIGGGIFKNQTNFTTHPVKLNSGDSIYFGSDGFCDQFGGPKGRKFGTRQLREIIGKVHDLPMKEAAMVFEHAWETWKSDQKQTDDVLLVGVKFK